jgi:hypothetical protein
LEEDTIPQMTISFKNDNDIIVYALEKIIAFAKHNQNIFLAQSVWWISSEIGLQVGLVVHIDSIRIRSEIAAPPTIVPNTIDKVSKETELRRQDKVLKESEEDLRDSHRLRSLATLKASGRTKTGRINPLASTKQNLKVSKGKAVKTYSLTEGIEQQEIQRRTEAGECLRCAWPPDWK